MARLKFIDSLRLKAIIAISCVILLSSSLITWLNYLNARNEILNTMNISATQTVKINAYQLSTWVQTRLAEVTVIANTQEVKSMDFTTAMAYLNQEQARLKDEFSTIGLSDAAGKLMLQDGKGGTFSVDIHTEDSFPQIMKGANVISDPFADKADNSRYIITAEVPVTDESGKVVGLVSGASPITTVFETNTKFHLGKTDKVFIIDKNGLVLYHPQQDMVLKYNMTKDGDVQYNDAIKSLINSNGGNQTVTVNGESRVIFAEAVPDTDWFMVLDVPVKEYTSALNNMLWEAFGTTGIFVILIIVLAIVFLNRFFFRVNTVTSKISEIAVGGGDLTKRIDEKYKDELGQLALNLNNMQDSLKQIISGVIRESRIVDENVSVVENNMEKLNEKIESVSATTDQMSAGMQETAASAEQISAISNEIGNAVGSISRKAQEGAVSAVEISERAEKLSNSALESQKIAKQTRSQVNEKLREAIEQSKAIEKISILSDSILQITSQTNLLALNAAIEAARAGEAGKGFAVVAEQIRKLAENSKDTVNEIQNVTKQVIFSVENLVQGSQQVLDYIETNVMKDYDLMVETGEHYFMDAEKFNVMTNDLSATAQELAVSLESIIRGINEIAKANSNSAEGTQYIVENITEIVANANEMMSMVNKTRASSETLLGMVDKFKV